MLAFDDAYEANVNDGLTVDEEHGVLENDVDPEASLMGAFLVEEPSHGSLTLNSDGSFKYIPDFGFEGTDEFKYVATDFVSSSQPAVVRIEVVPGEAVEGDLNEDQLVNGQDVELMCDAIFLGLSDMGRDYASNCGRIRGGSPLVRAAIGCD